MIEIRTFDPERASAAEWAEYQRFRRVRAEEDEPDEPILSDAEFEHDTRRQWPLHESRRFIACQDGRIVGSLGFGFRRQGTPDYDSYARLLYAWGGVERCWRRRGVATALLRPLHAFMLERGKATMTAGASLPDGHAFLAAIGAVEKQRSYVNRLDLARVDWEQLARWQAAAVPPSSGLRWEFHAGRVPMARLAELQPQFSALLGDVPLGALDMPPLRVELPSYVSWYAEMDRRGGEHFLVVLLDGADVAGICEAHWSARFPDRVYQELTGVARGWRGRGLAKALKAAMLRLVRERLPDVTLMSTFNAEGNAAILAINRRLGFTVHRRDSSYQLGREALGAWLARR